MSIISIRTNRPRLHPLGSRKRHYEPAVQSASPPAPSDDYSQLDTARGCNGKGLRKSVRLLIPIFIFAAIYLYGMLDQVSSTNALTNFENNLFVFLAPAMLLAVGGINTYGLWRSRRSTAHKAHHT